MGQLIEENLVPFERWTIRQSKCTNDVVLKAMCDYSLTDVNPPPSPEHHPDLSVLHLRHALDKWPVFEHMVSNTMFTIRSLLPRFQNSAARSEYHWILSYYLSVCLICICRIIIVQTRIQDIFFAYRLWTTAGSQPLPMVPQWEPRVSNKENKKAYPPLLISDQYWAHCR